MVLYLSVINKNIYYDFYKNNKISVYLMNRMFAKIFKKPLNTNFVF